MNNDKGSAVIIVLLFLGIVSVVGAGLMLQSSVDRQFTSAVKSVDSLRDVASMAAGKSYWALKDVYSAPVSDTTDPVVHKTTPTDDPGNDEGKCDSRYCLDDDKNPYEWRLIFVDKGEGAVAGYEAATGGGGSYGAGTAYNTLWTSEGRGKNISRGDSGSRVQIAIKKTFSGGH